MKAAKPYRTTSGIYIPSFVMARVCERLANEEDWQKVGTEELRSFIPQSDDDLSELNDVLNECETRNLNATP